MVESKNQSGGKGNKFKPGARAGKSNDNANGVPLLRFGVNTNLHVWKLKMTVMAMQRYGDLARLLERDEYYVPPVVTLEDLAPSSQPTIKVEPGDDSDERDVSSLGRTRKGTTAKSSAPVQEQKSTTSSEMSAFELKIKEGECYELSKHRIKSIAKMRDDRAPFYACIIEHLSRESLDEVKKDSEYDQFDHDKDPLALWLAIKRTHKIGSDSGVNIIKKSDARQKYANAKQGSYEGITAYKERFDYLVDAYVTAGNKELDAEDIATDYLRSLDDSRYKELKYNIENDELMGYNQIPKTLSAMHALACNFKVMKKQSVTNHGTAFATSGSTKNGNNFGTKNGNQNSKGAKDSQDSGGQDCKRPA